ncbi:MAG: GreA/GreB family elongation factor [Bacteroidales bacterium]|jgi:transcription elongation factor GreB|nr:GreA/GreB family elongation factor [Bacteroidales bacterium]
MSRGFVKEEDQENVPVVNMRAYLPDGVPNYVTPNGYRQLIEEKEGMLTELTRLSAIDGDTHIETNYIDAKMKLLNDRLLSARVVDTEKNSTEIVMFGSIVSVSKNGSEQLLQYQIVGADEADTVNEKISFVSPLAKMLMNKRVGEEIVLKTPKGNDVYKIINVD